MAVFELEESVGPEPGESGGGYKAFDPIAEDTVIEAKIGTIEVRPHPFFKDDDGNPEIKVNWEFLFELNGDKRKLWGDTPTTFTTHPDCKLRNWVQQALGGGELPAGFKANTDTLTGNPIRIVVGYREWKDADGNKKWRNSVKDVMYSKGASSAPTFMEEPFSLASSRAE